ncbi:MAG: NAD(P)/FAD-dependent oxidoreductase [Bacteroidia bacterium]
MDKYDVAIIGAGIAGSTLAILLAKEGKSVVVFEKNKLPKHKVCGEFVSMESYNFFKSIGLNLDQWNLPIIKNLRLTSQNGDFLRSDMDVGGFGISRYKLDLELAKLMIENGVTFLEQTKVTHATKNQVSFDNKTIHASLVVSAHGKYSPSYNKQLRLRKSKNYVAVKYHIRGDFSEDLITLHSFEQGYCGMSKVEDDLYCLCYLVNSTLLKSNNNNISELEKNVLHKNELLKQLFKEADFVWKKPLTISNIQFTKNKLVQDGIIQVGDAAGAISPLSGNGMSIAAKSALLLSQLILLHNDESTLISTYEKNWNRLFLSKTQKASILNQIMLNPLRHSIVLKLLKLFSPLRKKIINEMQGDEFVRSSSLIR